MHMVYRRGFTIVEVAVVLAIMAILLVLGLSAYTNNQVAVRNAERQEDATNIARAIERYYASGNASNSTQFGAYAGLPGGKGNYPSLGNGANETQFLADLPGIEDASRSVSFGSLTFKIDGADFSGTLQVDNTNSDTRITNALGSASNQNFTIVYQPITWDSANNYWALCRNGAECRRFKLYYLLEGNPVPQTIESKNQ